MTNRFLSTPISILSLAVAFTCNAVAESHAASPGDTARARTAAPVPRMPAALRGIWFPTSREGRDGCATYLRVHVAQSDATWAALIGAIVISPRVAHHVSDMGEGNFYEATRVTALATGQWRVLSRLGIDGPGDPQAEQVTTLLKLKSGQLHWRDVGEPADAGRDTYTRCTTRLPAGTDR